MNERESPRGTICKCGSAKAYHRDIDKRDHEYEPRYPARRARSDRPAAPAPLDGPEHEVWCWRRHTGHCVDGPSDAPAEAAPPPLDGLRCVKCGWTDIGTAWHQDTFGGRGMRTCAFSEQYAEGQHGEHLHHNCRNCRFEWRAALRDEGETT